jgi:iron complex transport system permease protein
MGDLSLAYIPIWAPLIFVVVLFTAMLRARSLNVLAIGETTARLLGENTKKLVWLVYLMASLLTAAAVSIAGSVGFIGLIIPHAVRLLVGPDHRVLIPAASLFGGTFLVLADTAARTVLAPQQLPVGVITALIGVPMFLFLLHKAKVIR